MWVLCHASTFIGIKENIVYVEGSCYEGLSISIVNLVVGSVVGCNFTNSEKALIKRADFDVNLDFVVLKSNKWKGKTWVAAE